MIILLLWLYIFSVIESNNFMSAWFSKLFGRKNPSISISSAPNPLLPFPLTPKPFVALPFDTQTLCCPSPVPPHRVLWKAGPRTFTGSRKALHRPACQYPQCNNSVQEWAHCSCSGAVTFNCTEHLCLHYETLRAIFLSFLTNHVTLWEFCGTLKWIIFA